MSLPIFQRTIVDSSGNIQPGASVAVRNETTGDLVPIFADREGGTAKANPFLADAEGFATFYVDTGEYKITATTPAGSITWSHVAIGDTALLELAQPTGSALVGFQQAGGVARTVESKLRESVSVKDFGAVGDGVADDTAAFNAAANYIRASFVDTPDYDYGVGIVIPPGSYSVSSWNLTLLLIQNLHIVAYGATLVARTTDKNVVDTLGSRYIKFHGLTVYSASTVAARSGIQLGPRDTETCGNFSFNDVSVLGYYSVAPLMNLGAETTTHRSCRYTQLQAGTGLYAEVCDGLSTYLPTSDYVSTPRVAGTALSFTNNMYYGTQVRNESNGSAHYLAGAVGWMWDNGCYHLAFNNYGFVVYATATRRCGDLTIKGLFESTQNGPTGGSGLQTCIALTGDGTPTAIDGFVLDTFRPHADIAVIENIGAGSWRIGEAQIRVMSFEQPTSVMFNNGASTISLDGVITCGDATRLNLAELSAFNGQIFVDSYAAIASLPTVGSYSINARTQNQTYYGGARDFIPFSFTPTVTFATPGDLSVSYSTQSATGTKIGKLVFFHVALVFTPTYTTSSGEFRIAGLPHSSNTATGQDSAINVANINSAWTWPSGTTAINGRVPTSSSQIRIVSHGAGVATATWTTANVPSGTLKSLILSGCYLAAS